MAMTPSTDNSMMPKCNHNDSSHYLLILTHSRKCPPSKYSSRPRVEIRGKIPGERGVYALIVVIHGDKSYSPNKTGKNTQQTRQTTKLGRVSKSSLRTSYKIKIWTKYLPITINNRKRTNNKENSCLKGWTRNQMRTSWSIKKYFKVKYSQF